MPNKSSSKIWLTADPTGHLLLTTQCGLMMNLLPKKMDTTNQTLVVIIATSWWPGRCWETACWKKPGKVLMSLCLLTVRRDQASHILCLDMVPTKVSSQWLLTKSFRESLTIKTLTLAFKSLSTWLKFTWRSFKTYWLLKMTVNLEDFKSVKRTKMFSLMVFPKSL